MPALRRQYTAKWFCVNFAMLLVRNYNYASELVDIVLAFFSGAANAIIVLIGLCQLLIDDVIISSA